MATSTAVPVAAAAATRVFISTAATAAATSVTPPSRARSHSNAPHLQCVSYNKFRFRVSETTRVYGFHQHRVS